MATRKAVDLWCLTAIAAAAIALGIGFRIGLRPEPVSMTEVIEIARTNGLWTSVLDDKEPGGAAKCSRIIASRAPLTDDEVDLLSMTHAESPRWRGCVCVMQFRPNDEIRHLSPIPGEIIGNGDGSGDLLLFGDHELAKTLKTWIVSSRKRQKN